MKRLHVESHMAPFDFLPSCEIDFNVPGHLHMQALKTKVSSQPSTGCSYYCNMQRDRLGMLHEQAVATAVQHFVLALSEIGLKQMQQPKAANVFIYNN